MSVTQEPMTRKSRPKRAGNLMVAIVPIVACFTAIYILWGYLIGPRDLGLLVALYILTGLGVSMGYHRLLTHRSFRTYPVIRYTLAQRVHHGSVAR